MVSLIVDQRGCIKMSEDTLKCSICGSENPVTSSKCSICSSLLNLINDEDRSILKALQQISGVGQQRAKKIMESGISTVEDLGKADLNSFLRVDGIGEATAREIVETIEESKKDDGGLYLCCECGAFVGEDSKSCPNCGAIMEEEEEEDEEEELEYQEEVIPTEDESSLYLCSNCGSFVSDELSNCTFCGSIIQQEDPGDISSEVEEEEEEGGLYLCTNCGSFVSASSDSCTFCGVSLAEDEEEEELEVLSDDVIDDMLEETIGELSSIHEPEDISYDEGPMEVNEHGLSTQTIKALALGDDIKICGNCGRICQFEDVKCPLCGFVDDSGEDTVKETIVDPRIDLARATSTLMKVLDLKEDPSVQLTDTREDVNVCMLCGAFVTENDDSCPICGGVVKDHSEIDISIDDVIKDRDYTDEDLFICDACGAFVDNDMKYCGICMSDLEYARRKVHDDVRDDELQKEYPVEAFFHGSETIEADSEEDNTCHFCGALFPEDSDRCPVCLSPTEDGLNLMVVDTSRRGGSKTLTEDIESIADLLDDEDLELEDVKDVDLIDEYIDKELGLEEFEEEEEEDELRHEDMFVVDEDLVEDDIPEMDLDEDLEYILDDEELQKIVSELSDERTIDVGEDDLAGSEHEEFDVSAILDEISERVKTESLEKEIIDIDIEDNEGWIKCQVCDSYISDESDSCGVCDHSLVQEPEEETRATRKVRKEVLDTDWIDDVLQGKIVNKKRTELKKRESVASDDVISGKLDRLREYEVPISSLTLMAFGGFSLYSYGEQSMSGMLSMGLVVTGIFLALGLFTLYILKDRYFHNSLYGLAGYSFALALAASVPLRICFLNMSLPTILDTALLGCSLGIFWILDFKIQQEFRYYMIWFFGILLIFIVLFSMATTSVTSFTELAYPMTMTLGLGTVLVFGGTTNWYRQATTESKAYDHIESGHRHLIRGDFDEAILSFEKADDVKTGDDTVSNYPLYSKGLAQCSVGLFEEAVETFRELLRNTPEDVCTWNNLGIAYSRMGDQKKAIRCLKRAIDIDPNYEISWNNLGNTMYRAGNYTKAVDCYDRALELNLNYRDAILNKSQAMVKLTI